MKIKIFIVSLAIFLGAISLSYQTPYADAHAAGIAGFKTDLIAALTNNFTAGQRTTIANSFVTAYQGEWNARVAAGTVDNAANRGSFAGGKMIDYIQDIVRAEQHKAALAAVPTPTPLPN